MDSEKPATVSVVMITLNEEGAIKKVVTDIQHRTPYLVGVVQGLR